jgi:hypothetical protein
VNCFYIFATIDPPVDILTEDESSSDDSELNMTEQNAGNSGNTSNHMSDSRFNLLCNSFPKFDGGKNGVSYLRFKHSYEIISSRCTADQTELLNIIIFSKLEGTPLQLIQNRFIDTAEGLFELFDAHYGSSKDVNGLLWDLYMIDASSIRNVKDLYHKIANLRDHICTHMIQQTEDAEAKRAINSIFESICASAFVRKLPNEIGNPLLLQKNDDLERSFEKALDFEKLNSLKDREHAQKVQKRSSKDHYKKHYKDKYKTKYNSYAKTNPTENTESSTSKSTETCTYCKRAGHTKDKCYSLKNKLKKEQIKVCNPIESSDSSDSCSSDESEDESNLNSFARTVDEGTDSH